MVATAFAAPATADIADQTPIQDSPKVAVSASVSTQSKTAVAANTDCSAKDKECWKGMIERYAKRYGVDSKLVVAVARCESELRTDVYGDHGLAYGIFQFHEETFNLFAREFHLEGLDYKNPEDSIKLAVLAFANGKEDHWSCYNKVASR